MKPEDSSEPTANTLISLRDHPDALKLITDRLKVQQMGPADWIRTKHEVKAWLATAGEAKEAEAIVARANARRALQQSQENKLKINQRQDRWQRLDQ